MDLKHPTPRGLPLGLYIYSDFITLLQYSLPGSFCIDLASWGFFGLGQEVEDDLSSQGGRRWPS